MSRRSATRQYRVTVTVRVSADTEEAHKRIKTRLKYEPPRLDYVGAGPFGAYSVRSHGLASVQEKRPR